METSMELLTLHQLSRELNKPEKVLRYKFKNLLKKNTLVEGEDFIREGYIDDKHFLFKINPLRFSQLTELAPAPLPDTPEYQRGTNVDTNGYQVGTKSVTNLDTKTTEVDTSVGNQKENVGTNNTQDNYNKTIFNDFIELMKEQLREKDKQLKAKDEQLKSKDELLKQAQEQTREKDNAQILAVSEIIRLNKKLLPSGPGETVINVDTNGYQTREAIDTNGGTQDSDVDTNGGNRGYQSDPSEHQQNNFHSDQSPGRGGEFDSVNH